MRKGAAFGTIRVIESAMSERKYDIFVMPIRPRRFTRFRALFVIGALVGTFGAAVWWRLVALQLPVVVAEEWESVTGKQRVSFLLTNPGESHAVLEAVWLETSEYNEDLSPATVSNVLRGPAGSPAKLGVSR